MVDDRLPRVFFVFETSWDRRQLTLCREAWEGQQELVFPEPSDTECEASFDALGFIERLVGGAFGRIDAVLSASDYPGATASPHAPGRARPERAPRRTVRSRRRSARSHRRPCRASRCCARAAPHACPSRSRCS
jgi:hypothetical protein